MEKKDERLTHKMIAFCRAYVSNGYHGQQAAEAAGYKGGYFGQAKVASDLLKRPKILRYIKDLTSHSAMEAEEVLSILGAQARGNLGDFLEIWTDYDTGEEIARLNWVKLLEEGGHLIEQFRKTKDGFHIKLYSAQAAATQLGKNHRLWVDVVEQDPNELWIIADDVPGEADDGDNGD